MSERVSETVLLCEDDMQARLVRAFMKVSGVQTRTLRERIASELEQGGNCRTVLNRFPEELRACRKRHQAKAKTHLIVMIDADDLSVDDRRRELLDELNKLDMASLNEHDSVSLLIPKRNVETWIRALNDEESLEDENYKRSKPPDKSVVRAAARRLHEWVKPDANVGENCVPSLTLSLPEWRKIH